MRCSLPALVLLARLATGLPPFLRPKDAEAEPGGHGMDMMPEPLQDARLGSFIDEVVAPARERARALDDKVVVGARNASAALECAHESGESARRVLEEADHRLLIIGAGPAGLAAAVRAARGGIAPLVVARDGGQLESTSAVDNYPGFADGIDAVELLLSLQRQATRFGAEFREG